MRKDIKIKVDGSLAIVNGDFVVAQSDQQHVENIVLAHPGEFKHSPMLGFAAMLKLKQTANDFAFKRDLKIQLEYDGYIDPKIDLSQGYENLKIDV